MLGELRMAFDRREPSSAPLIGNRVKLPDTKGEVRVVFEKNDVM
jgi:hypothetical protein